MSSFRLPLKFEGSKGENIFNILFDENNYYSCISEEKANDIANLISLFKPRKISIGGANEIVEIINVVVVDFFINDIHLSDEFFVVPNLFEDVIMGETTIRKWRMKLDFDINSVNVNPTVAELKLI